LYLDNLDILNSFEEIRVTIPGSFENSRSTRQTEEGVVKLAKRVYNKKQYEKTCLSKRARRQDPNNNSPGRAVGARVYSLLSTLLLIITNLAKDIKYIEALLSSFWPD
jgi:hypothetical protein